MIKIFQLVKSIHLGGAEIVAFNIAESCASSNFGKFQFVVVELHKSYDDYSIQKKAELKAKNIRYISLSNGSKNLSLIFGPIMLVYHILKEKPNIINVHTDLPDWVLSNTIRIFRFFRLSLPKIVRTIHNTTLWPTRNKVGKLTEISYINDHIVGVSEAALEAYKILRNKYDLPISNNLQVIYNGCELPSRQEHPFKIDKGKINVAFCGRFELQKGVDVLLNRISKINERCNGAFLFHFIGSGFFFDDINRLTKETNNVIVYDAVPNVSDKLYDFDFLIVPSRFEGLGLVSLEATFSNVLVIATNVKGLNETLPPNWPLLFDLHKEDELVSIFENIVNNKYDLNKLKEQVYAFVSTKFSQSTMISAYSNLYQDIVK